MATFITYGPPVDPLPWAAMIRRLAPVAELVDAADSKSVGGDIVLVRVRPGAPVRLTTRQPWTTRRASL
jgi:rRNA maturation protein Rpf1